MHWNQGGIALLLALLCCSLSDASRQLLQDACCPLTASAFRGRLEERPQPGGKEEAGKGLQTLNVNPEGRDGWLFIPDNYTSDTPAPAILLLHGALKAAKDGLDGDFKKFQEIANSKGVILIAPDSRTETWDRLAFGQFGPDVAYISEALKKVFGEYAVDRNHLGIAGFSDGATYALSLGINNGDLFTKIIAFSPGGLFPSQPTGQPEIFISHGVSDDILPFDLTNQRVVPLLRENGYNVTFREFEGTHWVPNEIAQEALDWFL